MNTILTKTLLLINTWEDKSKIPIKIPRLQKLVQEEGEVMKNSLWNENYFLNLMTRDSIDNDHDHPWALFPLQIALKLV